MTPALIASSTALDTSRNSFAIVIVNDAWLLERVITGRCGLTTQSCFVDHVPALMNALLDRGFKGETFRGVTYQSWHHAALDFITSFFRSVGLCHIRDFGPDYFPVGERLRPREEDLLVCWDLVCELALRWKEVDHSALTSGVSRERIIYASKWIDGVSQFPNEPSCVTGTTAVSPSVSRNESDESQVFFSAQVTDKNLRRVAMELAKRDGRDKIAICREIAGMDKAKSLETKLNRYINRGHIRFEPLKPR